MLQNTGATLLNFKESFKESLLKNHLASSLASRLRDTLQSLKKPTKVLDYEANVPLQVGTTAFSAAPRKMRKELWLSVLQRGGIATTALQKYKDVVNQEIGAEVAEQIEKDLGRTFPSYKRFRTSQGKAALRNVLRAYASFDPEVGYCQGMNFLTGLLLMYLEEEDAFAALVVIMYERDFREYYLDDMALLQKHLWHLSKLMPADLCEHLEASGVVPVLFGASWFMTCYAADFPACFAARILDVVLVGNIEVTMLKVALELMLECKDKVQAKSGLEDVLAFFKYELPGWDEEILQDVLTKAFLEGWDARQLEVLASSEGAESIADAMARVHVPQQLLQVPEPPELSPISSGMATPEMMSPTSAASPRQSNDFNPGLVLLPPPPGSQRSARSSLTGAPEAADDPNRASSHYCYQLLSSNESTPLPVAADGGDGTGVAPGPTHDDGVPEPAVPEPTEETHARSAVARGGLARLLSGANAHASTDSEAGDEFCKWEEAARPRLLSKSVTSTHHRPRAAAIPHLASVESGLDALANGAQRIASHVDGSTLGRTTPPTPSPPQGSVNSAYWSAAAGHTASLSDTDGTPGQSLTSDGPGMASALEGSVMDGMTSSSVSTSVHGTSWGGNAGSLPTTNLMDLEGMVLSAGSSQGTGASRPQGLSPFASSSFKRASMGGESNSGHLRPSSGGESDWDDMLLMSRGGDSRDLSFTNTLRGSSEAMDPSTSRQSSLPLAMSTFVSRAASILQFGSEAGAALIAAAGWDSNASSEAARQVAAAASELSFSGSLEQSSMAANSQRAETPPPSPDTVSIDSLLGVPNTVPSSLDPSAQPMDLAAAAAPDSLLAVPYPGPPPPTAGGGKDYVSPTKPSHRRKLSDMEAIEPLLGEPESPLAGTASLPMLDTPRGMLPTELADAAEPLLQEVDFGGVGPATIDTPRLGRTLPSSPTKALQPLPSVLEESLHSTHTDAPLTTSDSSGSTQQYAVPPSVLDGDGLVERLTSAEVDLLGSPVGTPKLDTHTLLRASSQAMHTLPESPGAGVSFAVQSLLNAQDNGSEPASSVELLGASVHAANEARSVLAPAQQLVPDPFPTGTNIAASDPFPTSTAISASDPFPTSTTIAPSDPFPTSTTMAPSDPFPTSTTMAPSDPFPTSTAVLAPDPFPSSTAISLLTPTQSDVVNRAAEDVALTLVRGPSGQLPPEQAASPSEPAFTLASLAMLGSPVQLPQGTTLGDSITMQPSTSQPLLLGGTVPAGQTGATMPLSDVPPTSQPSTSQPMLLSTAAPAQHSTAPLHNNDGNSHAALPLLDASHRASSSGTETAGMAANSSDKAAASDTGWRNPLDDLSILVGISPQSSTSLEARLHSLPSNNSLLGPSSFPLSATSTGSSPPTASSPHWPYPDIQDHPWHNHSTHSVTPYQPVAPVAQTLPASASIMASPFADPFASPSMPPPPVATPSNPTSHPVTLSASTSVSAASPRPPPSGWPSGGTAPIASAASGDQLAAANAASSFLHTPPMAPTSSYEQQPGANPATPLTGTRGATPGARFRSAAHAALAGHRALVSRFQDVVHDAVQQQLEGRRHQQQQQGHGQGPPGNEQLGSAATRGAEVSPRRLRSHPDDVPMSLEDSILANIESFASVPSTTSSVPMSLAGGTPMVAPLAQLTTSTSGGMPSDIAWGPLHGAPGPQVPPSPSRSSALPGDPSWGPLHSAPIPAPPAPWLQPPAPSAAALLTSPASMPDLMAASATTWGPLQSSTLPAAASSTMAASSFTTMSHALSSMGSMPDLAAQAWLATSPPAAHTMLQAALSSPTAAGSLTTASSLQSVLSAGLPPATSLMPASVPAVSPVLSGLLVPPGAVLPGTVLSPTAPAVSGIVLPAPGLLPGSMASLLPLAGVGMPSMAGPTLGMTYVAGATKPGTPQSTAELNKKLDSFLADPF